MIAFLGRTGLYVLLLAARRDVLLGVSGFGVKSSDGRMSGWKVGGRRIITRSLIKAQGLPEVRSCFCFIVSMLNAY